MLETVAPNAFKNRERGATEEPLLEERVSALVLGPVPPPVHWDGHHLDEWLERDATGPRTPLRPLSLRPTRILCLEPPPPGKRRPPDGRRRPRENPRLTAETQILACMRGGHAMPRPDTNIPASPDSLGQRKRPVSSTAFSPPDLR